MMKRREFVRTTVTVGTAIGALNAFPVLAAVDDQRKDEMFLATDPDEAVKGVFGALEAEENNDMVKVDAPLQAENGAIVPIKITTAPGVERIAIVIKKNPTPLLTVLKMGPKSGGHYSLRVKMAGTDKVYAYAQAGNKLYVTHQDVRVAVGGCGG